MLIREVSPGLYVRVDTPKTCAISDSFVEELAARQPAEYQKLIKEVQKSANQLHALYQCHPNAWWWRLKTRAEFTYYQILGKAWEVKQPRQR